MKKTKWLTPIILTSIFLPTTLISSKCNPKMEETINVDKEIKLIYIGSDNQKFEQGSIDKDLIKINDLQLEINNEKIKDKYNVEKIMINFDNGIGHLLFQLIDKKTNKKSQIYSKDFTIPKNIELKNFFIETKTQFITKINEEKIKKIKDIVQEYKIKGEDILKEMNQLQNDSSIPISEKRAKIKELMFKQQKTIKIFMISNAISYLYDNIDVLIDQIDNFKTEASVFSNEIRIQIKKEIAKIIAKNQEIEKIDEEVLYQWIDNDMLLFFQSSFNILATYFNKVNLPFLLTAQNKFKEILEQSKNKTVVLLIHSKECSLCKAFLKYWNEKHIKTYPNDFLYALDINFGTEEERKNAYLISEIINTKLGMPTWKFNLNLPFFTVIKDKKIVGNSLFVPNENDSWENKLLSQRH